MFIKTLKYDFLFSRDMFLGLAAGLLAFSAILRLTLVRDSVHLPTDVLFSSDALFGFALFFCGIIVIVQMMQFFNKNFFEDTGYLMFTLPVKRFHLFVSKVVVAFVWFNFILLTAYASSAIYSAHGIGRMMNDVFSLLNIIALLEINLIAMLTTLTLFFVITLAHSKIWRWRIHSAIAALVGVSFLWLFFGVAIALSQRSFEVVTVVDSWPERVYDAYGMYMETYYHYWPWSSNRPIVGLTVGRIRIGEGNFGFFDIYRWGAGFAVCILLFIATYYLLKKRVSL